MLINDVSSQQVNDICQELKKISVPVYWQINHY